jgi:hypothetical protein
MKLAIIVLFALRAVHPLELEVETKLLEFEAELARLEGRSWGSPEIGAGVGPRRTVNDETELDVEVSLELPRLATRPAASALRAAIRDGAELLRAAARREADLVVAELMVRLWSLRSQRELASQEHSSMTRWRNLVAGRVAEGADAPFELTLVEAELARVTLEQARLEAGIEATVRAIGVFEVATDFKDLGLEAFDAPVPCSALPPEGLFMKADKAEQAMAEAVTTMRQRLEQTRWSVSSELAQEGEEQVARVGMRYRTIPRKAIAAQERSRRAAVVQLTRSLELRRSERASQLATAAARWGRPAVDVTPEQLEAGLNALKARVEEGKDVPSQVLPLMRQLLGAQRLALEVTVERAQAALVLKTYCAEDLP